MIELNYMQSYNLRISYYLVEKVLTLPDIILHSGGTAYPSGYLMTWLRNRLPFRISYYLVEEMPTLPDIILPGGGTAYP
jgi:hypothetical protein